MNVSARAFSAVQNLNIGDLLDMKMQPTFSEKEIRPFLVSLFRASILPATSDTAEWQEIRKQILLILVESETVNNIAALLQVNYSELEIDIKKEQQLR